MEISECVIQINSETNFIILVASGQGMFMKNGIILSIADRIKDALPIPTDEFRKRLEEDCYVIWKLPQFYIRGFAPIFPDTCYHLTHHWPAAADIPVASDNPAHYADAIRYNARTPLQGSLLPLTRLVWA